MLNAAVSLCFLFGMAVLSENNESREQNRIWRLSVTKSPCTVRRISRGDVSGIFVVITNSCRTLDFGRLISDRFRHCAAGFSALRDAEYAHGQSSLSGISPSDSPIYNFIQRFAGKRMTDVPI